MNTLSEKSVVFVQFMQVIGLAQLTKQAGLLYGERMNMLLLVQINVPHTEWR